MNTVASPLSDGSQPAGEANSSRRTLLAAPLPNPHVSTSHARVTLAGKDTSLADDRPASFLSDDPWLAATRESQGQPIDAIPRTGDWPYTVNREGEIIDMRNGEVACELMAQLGLGIKGL